MELNKVLPFFIQPFFIVLALILAGSFMHNRKRGKLLVLCACLILLIGGSPQVSDFLLEHLQTYYPTVSVAGCPPTDAVVVLGGIVGDPRKGLNMEWYEGVDRFEQAVNLLRAQKARRIIFTSGPEDEEGDGRFLYSAALDHGIAKDAILYTTRSYNTIAESENIKQLAAREGIRSIILVTSAFHMRRAMMIFKRTGLAVQPFPVDYGCCNSSKPRKLQEYLPAFGVFIGTEKSIREYAGVLYYTLRGY